MCLTIFNVSNVFECGRNKPDVSYKKAYRSTERHEYFTEMLEHLNEYNDLHGQIFPVKNLKEDVLQVMEEEGEEIERNINNITCYTSFQSPITINVQKKYANLSVDKQLASGVLA